MMGAEKILYGKNTLYNPMDERRSNRCENWAYCPLGDMAKYIGCRKPHCPKYTFANAPRPFTKDLMVKNGPK
jgi:hypothetical protein